MEAKVAAYIVELRCIERFIRRTDEEWLDSHTRLC
jgi:hypothetical protein